MKIINLSKTTPAHLVIQPAFQIRQYDVCIKFNGKSFICTCGCLKNFEVSPDNIDRILFEVNGGVNEPADIQLVVEKATTQKAIDAWSISRIDNDWLFLEETANVFITKSLRARDKKEYKIMVKKFALPNTYFSDEIQHRKEKGVDKILHYREFMDRAIDEKDLANIKFLLEKMKAHFDDMSASKVKAPKAK